MSIWRRLWSVLDDYVLRVFDSDDASLVRAIAEPLPDNSRDLSPTA